MCLSFLEQVDLLATQQDSSMFLCGKAGAEPLSIAQENPQRKTQDDSDYSSIVLHRWSILFLLDCCFIYIYPPLQKDISSCMKNNLSFTILQGNMAGIGWRLLPVRQFLFWSLCSRILSVSSISFKILRSSPCNAVYVAQVILLRTSDCLNLMHQ